MFLPKKVNYGKNIISQSGSVAYANNYRCQIVETMLLLLYYYYYMINNNHLFHFSTSILHGSSSKTKIYGS